MPAAPKPIDEERRLATLRSLEILDTEPEKFYSEAAILASQMFSSSIGLVSLVDNNRQWFKAKVGLKMSETPRDAAFCSYAILRSEVLCVNDAMRDCRFSDNMFVTGAPFVRFYSGAPLIIDGARVGTLCVIDDRPRNDCGHLLPHIERLAAIVSEHMALRRELSLTRAVVGHTQSCREVTGR